MDELLAGKNHPGWFECDAARRIASIKSEFYFGECVQLCTETSDLLQFYKECRKRRHKATARHRTQYINREMASQKEHIVKLQLQK